MSQNSQENPCATVSFCNFIKKKTLAKVFTCEFCKISKPTFSKEHLGMTVSENSSWLLSVNHYCKDFHLRIDVCKDPGHASGCSCIFPTTIPNMVCNCFSLQCNSESVIIVFIGHLSGRFYQTFPELPSQANFIKS